MSNPFVIEDDQIEKAIKKLESRQINADILKDPSFDNEQKFALYQALIQHQDVQNIADPKISVNEMDNIREDEHRMMQQLHQNHGIIPENYKLNQLYELNEALNKGFDISHYKSPEFSATHMYLARTYQENNLPLDDITPQTPLPMIVERKNELINEVNDRKIESELAAYDPMEEAKYKALYEFTNELGIIFSGERDRSELDDLILAGRECLLDAGFSNDYVKAVENISKLQCSIIGGYIEPALSYIRPEHSPERINLIGKIVENEQTSAGYSPMDYNYDQLTVLETASANNDLPPKIFNLDPDTTSAKAFEIFCNEKHNLNNLNQKYVMIAPGYVEPDLNHPPYSYFEFNTVDEVLDLVDCYNSDPNKMLGSKLRDHGYLDLSSGETLHISDEPDKIGRALIKELGYDNVEIIPTKNMQLSTSYEKQVEHANAINAKINNEINSLIEGSQLSVKQDQSVLINWNNGAVRVFPTEQKAIEMKSSQEDLVKVEPRALEKYAAQKFHEKGKEFQKTQSPRIDEGLSLL